MGTKDIVVVKNSYQSDFAREVLREIQRLEANGYTVEVKYAVGEGKFDNIVFTALLHAYEEGN